LLIQTPALVVIFRRQRWMRRARTIAEYAVTIGAGILASYLIVHARL
jgi:Flp pilus assembly protein protease CpaA